MLGVRRHVIAQCDTEQTSVRVCARSVARRTPADRDITYELNVYRDFKLEGRPCLKRGRLATLCRFADNFCPGASSIALLG